MVIAQDNVITVDDLPEMVRRMHEESVRASEAKADMLDEAEQDAAPLSPVAPLWEEGRDFHSLVQEKLEEFERNLLRSAMEASGWNQTETARRLRLPLRTLARKVKLYGLARPR